MSDFQVFCVCGTVAFIVAVLSDSIRDWVNTRRDKR